MILYFSFYLLAPGNEYKPQHMCHKCISKLGKFANFIDLSHKNDLKFDSLYKSCLEVSKKEKTGKLDQFVMSAHQSANEILESRENNEEVNNSKFDSQRRRLSLSVQRSKKPLSRRRYSVATTRQKLGLNKFHCDSEKNREMPVKSRLKQQQKIKKNINKNRSRKKKYSYQKYLDLCKKYLRVTSSSKRHRYKSVKPPK